MSDDGFNMRPAGWAEESRDGMFHKLVVTVVVAQDVTLGKCVVSTTGRIILSILHRHFESLFGPDMSASDVVTHLIEEVRKTAATHLVLSQYLPFHTLGESMFSIFGWLINWLAECRDSIPWSRCVKYEQQTIPI